MKTLLEAVSVIRIFPFVKVVNLFAKSKHCFKYFHIIELILVSCHLLIVINKFNTMII